MSVIYQLMGKGLIFIDDEEPSLEKVYSSSKVDELISGAAGFDIKLEGEETPLPKEDNLVTIPKATSTKMGTIKLGQYGTSLGNENRLQCAPTDKETLISQDPHYFISKAALDDTLGNMSLFDGDTGYITDYVNGYYSNNGGQPQIVSDNDWYCAKIVFSRTSDSTNISFTTFNTDSTPAFIVDSSNNIIQTFTTDSTDATIEKTYTFTKNSGAYALLISCYKPHMVSISGAIYRKSIVQLLDNYLNLLGSENTNKEKTSFQTGSKNYNDNVDNIQAGANNTNFGWRSLQSGKENKNFFNSGSVIAGYNNTNFAGHSLVVGTNNILYGLKSTEILDNCSTLPTTFYTNINLKTSGGLLSTNCWETSNLSGQSAIIYKTNHTDVDHKIQLFVKPLVSNFTLLYLDHKISSGQFAFNSITSLVPNVWNKVSLPCYYTDENGDRQDSIQVVVSQNNFCLIGGILLVSTADEENDNTVASSIVCGDHNTNFAESSIVFGSGNKNTSPTNQGTKLTRSLVGGAGNNNNAESSILVGEGLQNTTNDSAKFGKFNENKTGAILEIGNGANNENRHNAFWIDENGNAHAEQNGTVDSSTLVNVGMLPSTTSDIIYSLGGFADAVTQVEIEGNESKDVTKTYLTAIDREYLIKATKEEESRGQVILHGKDSVFKAWQSEEYGTEPNIKRGYWETKSYTSSGGSPTWIVKPFLEGTKINSERKICFWAKVFTNCAELHLQMSKDKNHWDDDVYFHYTITGSNLYKNEWHKYEYTLTSEIIVPDTGGFRIWSIGDNFCIGQVYFDNDITQAEGINGEPFKYKWTGNKFMQEIPESFISSSGDAAQKGEINSIIKFRNIRGIGNSDPTSNIYINHDIYPGFGVYNTVITYFTSGNYYTLVTTNSTSNHISLGFKYQIE